MKKLARKIALIAILLFSVSFFFGQTLKSLFTPKADFVRASASSIVRETTLTGTFFLESSQDVWIYGARKFPIVPERIEMEVGDRVENGTPLFTARLFEPMESEREQLNTRIREMRQEWILLEKDRSKYKEVLDVEDFLDTQEQILQVKQKLFSDCLLRGVSLPEDFDQWGRVIARSGDRLLAKQYAELEEKVIAQQDISVGKLLAKHRAGDIEFAIRENNLLSQIEAAENEMLALIREEESLSNVVASESGIVSDIYLKKGAKYSGEEPAYSLSLNGGIQVRVNVANRGEREDIMAAICEISYQGVTMEAHPVERNGEDAIFSIDEKTIRGNNLAIREIAGKSATVSLRWQSAKYDTVISTGCIMSEGERKYIYVVEEYKDSWGNEFIARKMEVSVIDYNDTQVAIREALPRHTLLAAYWDAELSDGGRVMRRIQ